MQRLERLEDVTWQANSTRRVSLDALPAGKRVRSLLLRVNLTGTKDAADALDGRSYPLAISGIRIGNYVQNIPGWALQSLLEQIRGRILMDPTDIPGSGTSFDVDFELEIPFRDPRQPGADDGSMPTELFVNRSLEITFDSATVYGVGNLTITGGTVRVMADLVDGTAVPQMHIIGYEDPGGRTFPLPPGIFKDCFILDGTGVGTITEAELSSVDMDVDGQPIMNNALHEQIVHAYNSQVAKEAAAELTPNAATRVPLIWHDQSGKSNLSKQPFAERQVQVRLQGTISNPRVVYWQAIEKNQEFAIQVGVATGAPGDATGAEPATAKGGGFNPMKPDGKKDRGVSRFLPQKWR